MFISFIVLKNKILRIKCHLFSQFNLSILTIDSLNFSSGYSSDLKSILYLAILPFRLINSISISSNSSFVPIFMIFSLSNPLLILFVSCSDASKILLLYSVCSQMILNLLCQLFLQDVMLAFTFFIS